MITNVFVMIATVFLNQPNPANVPPAVCYSFAIVESSGVNKRPYWDVNGPAWGMYAFHRDRWVESGGRASEWGVATPERQTEVMLKALTKYVVRCRKANVPLMPGVANCHNLGSPSKVETKYVRKIWKEIPYVE